MDMVSAGYLRRPQLSEVHVQRAIGDLEQLAAVLSWLCNTINQRSRENRERAQSEAKLW